MIDEAFRSLVVADGACAALIGARMYPDELPEGVTYPAVMYWTAGGHVDISQDGPSGLRRTEFHVVAYARTDGEVTAVKKALNGVLAGYRGRVGSPAMVVQGIFPRGERDDMQEALHLTDTVHSKVLVFLVWHEGD